MSWTLPVIPPPPVDTGVEVNLGNSDQGFGDSCRHKFPASLHRNNKQIIILLPLQQAQAETQPEVAENNDADAPVIHTSPKPEKKKELAVKIMRIKKQLLKQ